METMTLAEQQDQQQRQQGYFTMPEAPNHGEYIDAIEAAFEDACQEYVESGMK